MKPREAADRAGSNNDINKNRNRNRRRRRRRRRRRSSSSSSAVERRLDINSRRPRWSWTNWGRH